MEHAEEGESLIHVAIEAETLFEIGPLAFTNSMVGALLASAVLMLLVANWIGLLPGVGTIGIKHITDGHEAIIPIVRPASADLNFTLGLAIVAFIMFVY